MADLKRAVETLDEGRFADLLINDVLDSEEVLMLLYASAVCFNSEKAFDVLLRRNNFFKHKHEWHSLFVAPRVFSKLQAHLTSSERAKLDLLVLGFALEKDLYFMADLVLSRSVVTPTLVLALMHKNEKKMLVQLLSKRPRPLFIEGSKEEPRELHFNDIICSALDGGEGA